MSHANRFDEVFDTLPSLLHTLGEPESDEALHNARALLLPLLHSQDLSDSQRSRLQQGLRGAIDSWGSSGRMQDRRRALRALATWIALVPPPWAEELLLASDDRLKDLCLDASNDPVENRRAFLDLLLVASAVSQRVRDRIATQVGPYLRSLEQEDPGPDACPDLAAVLLLKLGSAGEKDAPPLPPSPLGDADRVAILATALLSSSPASLPADIEGLAIASLTPALRPIIAGNAPLIARIHALSLKPEECRDGMLYGLASLWANLLRYRTRLSTQEEQVQRLRAMADASNASSPSSAPPAHHPDGAPGEKDPEVRARVKALAQAGAIDAVISLALVGLKHPASQVGPTCAYALSAILAEPELRGKVAAAGGARILLALSLPPGSTLKEAAAPSPSPATEGEKVAAHALAMMVISLDPTLLLPGQALYVAVRPILGLCLSSEPGKRQYDALMALTNLCVSPEGRERFFALGGLARVESLVLEAEEEPRIRRAATECLCNAMMDPTAIEAYASHPERIRLLGAMADQEDLPTRLAATGALAILLGNAPDVAGPTALSPSLRILPILLAILGLEGEDEGVRHRTLECVRAIAEGSTEGAKALVVAEPLLASIIASHPPPHLLQPAIDALKAIRAAKE